MDTATNRSRRHKLRMEATLAHGFHLPDLATHLAVSKRPLNRRFKQAMGIGPLEYLQTLRVEVAKRMLKIGNLTVEEVCRSVGYADLSTFRTLFKRKTGLSSRDYQNRFTRAARTRAEVGLDGLANMTGIM